MPAARLCAFLLAALLSACILSAQTPTSPAAQPSSQLGSQLAAQHSPIQLNVEVQNNHAQPIPALTQSAFTLLDNGSPQPITSFREVHPGQQPVHITLLIDAVNIGYMQTAYVRNEIAKFFSTESGPLPYPMQLSVLTDKGLEVAQPYTTDRAVMLNSVQHSPIALRELTRSAGFWGADERLSYSLNGLQQLVATSAPLPGRKLLIWISPGWPLLSGPGVYLEAKDQDRIFHNVVSYSTQLRLANITIYNLNPLGVNESLVRSTYYEAFLKAPRKPSDTQLANLSLQVLSVQTGGLVVESNSDISGLIRRCLQDAQDWYELTFTPARADSPSEYHHLELRLADPGSQVRTRDGYYAQP